MKAGPGLYHILFAAPCWPLVAPVEFALLLMDVNFLNWRVFQRDLTQSGALIHEHCP